MLNVNPLLGYSRDIQRHAHNVANVNTSGYIPQDNQGHYRDQPAGAGFHEFTPQSGFFRVTTDQGGHFLRKSTGFQVDQNGEVITSFGESLNPAIKGAQPGFPIDISSTGEISQQGNLLGQLQLEYPSSFTPEGGGLYRTSDRSVTTGPGTIQSGPQANNVDLAAEFVGLLAAEHGYKAYLKVLQTDLELTDEVLKLKR